MKTNNAISEAENKKVSIQSKDEIKSQAESKLNILRSKKSSEIIEDENVKNNNEEKEDEFVIPPPTMKQRILKYIKPKQNSSLIPTLTVLVGIFLCFIFFILLLFNLIFMSIGFLLLFFLPRYDAAQLANLMKENITGSENERLGNKLLFIVVPVLKSIGTRFFLLGFFTIFLIILGIISICGRFQIAFFIFLLGFFIVALFYFFWGLTMVEYIRDSVRGVLFNAFFKNFDKNKCSICNVPTSDGPRTSQIEPKPPENLETFEIALRMSSGTMKCCGINNSSDYKEYNNNRVPVQCCKIFTKPCDGDNTLPGCLKVLMASLEDSPRVIFYLKLAFIISMPSFMVFVVGVLETISFYVNDHHLD